MIHPANAINLLIILLVLIIQFIDGGVDPGSYGRGGHGHLRSAVRQKGLNSAENDMCVIH